MTTRDKKSNEKKFGETKTRNDKIHKIRGLSHKCRETLGNYQRHARDVVRDKKQALKRL